MLPALVGLAAALFLGTAGTPALVDDDVDAAHALVAREMLARHDWVVPYQDGIRYLIRPPLHFWLVAGSYAVLGESAFSTRLPVALAMVGLVAMTFVFGRRFLGARAGFYAALAVATGPGFFLFTRVVIPEAIYALEFTAIFYLFLRAWTGSLDPRVGYPGAAALTGLAAMTRGPIGVLFPALAVAVFLLVTGGWRRWRELRLPLSAAVFLAVVAPWHVLAARRAPGFLWAYFVNEHVLRALGTREPRDYSAVPAPLWLAEHLVWLFPWSLFAPGLVRILPPRREWRGGDAGAAARLLLFSWAAVIVVFFLLESGSRMEYYSFGAWPALALLLGAGIADAERRGAPWVRRLAAGLAVFGLAYAGLVAAFLVATRGLGAGDVAADVKSGAAETYLSAMARLRDVTPATLADLRVPLALSAASLAIGLGAAWLLRRRGRAIGSAAAMAGAMAGLFLAANLAYARLEPMFSSKGLARELNAVLRPTDVVALYGDIRVAPGVAFYCRRRVLLWNARLTNLAFGARDPDAPKTLYDDADFRALWNGDRRVVLVVPADAEADALARLPAGSYRVLARSGGKTAWVNRAG